MTTTRQGRCVRAGAAVAVALLIQGCSEAGPFVKNIYRAGDHVITVEKCTLHNGFFVLSEEDCTTETFRLTKQDRAGS